ncbi:uroporphyrinogen-III synthase [Methanolobus halotolerans]|uniref:Uroporphyrinogen-III synthase n=1 Tax=Methanolobus halotolerans TaxID=2052935 RepID=A0A4E0R0N4_9EURY|nr:uroporphyrinogen-III synthase [Methanolobus halotolerans]TGC10556.1 uroporphyrinogen-III synthase [Methanolobus halotolerans]
MSELLGKPKIAIMRPKRYVEESRELAESMGFEAIMVPMVEIAEMKDAGFEDFVERILEGKSDYVIFTSANGIDFTLGKIPPESRGKFIAALNSTNVVAIGPTTCKALEKLGIEVMGMPGVYSSEGIVDYLCADVAGKIIDTARSFYGSAHLIEGLRKCGAMVYETNVYTLEKPEGSEQDMLMDATLKGDISVFAFTSSMMVRNFFEHARNCGSEEDAVLALNNSMVAAIGGPTARTLESYGVNVSVIPGKFTFKEVLKKVQEELS